MPRSVRAIVLASAAIFLAAPRQVSANTCTWNGTTSTGWSTAANWDTCGGTTPQSGDTVSIPAGTPNAPTLFSTESITSFTVAAGATLTTSGGNLTISAASSVAGTLNDSGTTLQGAGDLSITGAMTVAGGTIDGPGTLTIGPAATLAINSTMVLGRAVTNGGTTNWNGGTVFFDPGGSFTNDNVFNAAGTNEGFNVPFTNSAGETFNQTGGGNAPMGAFANSGTVNVNGGTLTLNGGGTSAGTFTVVAGKSLVFASGAFNLTSATLSGAGDVFLNSGGGITLTGPYAITGTTSVGGGTPANPINFNQAGTVTFGTLITGGTLAGSATLSVTGSMTVSGGEIDGPGILTMEAGATMTIGSSVTLGRNVTNSGTTFWNSGTVFNGGGSFTNGNVFNAVGTNEGFNVPFTNSAGKTFNQTGGGTAPMGAFANSGTVNVNGGTLTLNGGGTSTGTFNVAAGKSLVFSSGTFDLTSATLSGAGNVTLNSGGGITLTGPYAITGTTSVGGGTPANPINFNQAGTVTFGTLITGGTLAGSATLSVTGSMTVSGGEIDGPGILTMEAGATMTIGSSVTLGRNVTNSGTTFWNSGTVFNGGGSFTNGNVFNAVGTNEGFNVPFTNSAGKTFNQTGGGTAPMGAFANSGTVNVNGGTLTLNGGGTSTGTFNVAAGKSLVFSSGTFDLTSATLSGAGNVTFNSGGGVTLAGTYGISGTTTVGGAVNFNQAGTVTFGTLITGGTLGGSATLSVTNAMTVTGGTINGPGPLTIESGATLTMGSSMTLGRAITNKGATNWNSGTVFNGGGSFTNAGGATFKAAGSSEGFNPPFTNAASATFNQPSGFSVLGPFSNAGAVNVNGGTILFNTFTQTSGSTNLLGGAITAPAGGLNIQGGTLTGAGSVSGPVSVSGTGILSPGSSPGTIATGNYGQTAGGFAVDLNGTTAGTTHDQLAVTGTVGLGGTLNVSVGYAPFVNDFYKIVANDTTSDPVTGTFAGLSENAQFLAGGVKFRINYAAGDGNDVVLTAITVPSNTSTPGSTANPSVFGQGVTFGVTVTGNGPTPTGTVEFFDGVSSLGTVALVSGAATSPAITTFSVGSHSITAQYSGDANFFGSTSLALSQIVNKADTTAALASLTNPTVFGQNVHLTATISVSSPGAGTPAGTVTFFDGVTPIGTQPVSGGAATLDTTSLSVATHSLTAVFNGDTNFNVSPASNTVSQVVDKGDSSTGVVSSGSPTEFGQLVTFTASVSVTPPAAGSPTGTVQFRDGGSPIGSPVALSSGSAGFSTTALPPGSRAITADYSGDGNFNSSNSPGITQVVNPAADIRLTKTVDNPAPVLSASVTFTVTATNNGPSNATGVEVTDLLPAGLSFVSASPSGSTTYSPATGLWSIGSLPNGASETLGVTAIVQTTGAIFNKAVVTAASPRDQDPSNDSATAGLNAGSVADVQVHKSVDNPAPSVGQDVVFTVTARNGGQANATGVAIQDLLPAGLSFVSKTPSGATTYDEVTGLWSIGALNAGSSATLQVTAHVNQTGTVNTALKVAQDQADPEALNDSSTVALNDPASADLALSKTVSPDPAHAGEAVSYVIAVTNNGPGPATNVSVTDTLPAGLSSPVATASQGSCVLGPPLSCSLGSLAAGASAVVNVSATKTVGGSLSNSASVTSDQSDPFGPNNSNTAATTPVELVRFEVE